MMDDLVVTGIVGILVLLIAGVLVIYGALSLIVTAAQAFASGQYEFVLFIIGAVLLFVLVYIASGLWLRRTDRI